MDTKPAYIYLLELSNGKYYVGKTTDVAKRFIDHKNGNGSQWTKQHGECKLIDIIESKMIFDEDAYTLKYMDLYGVDNVRGGSYANSTLSKEQHNNILRSIRNAKNLCMICGESDHYANMCGKLSLHYERHLTTQNKSNTQSDESNENTTSSDNIYCTRCKRSNHFIDNCYAATDIYGKTLHSL